MRWPLRNQILVPVLLLVLVILVTVSLINARLAFRSAQKQIDQNLSQISRTMAGARIPLTRTVLVQIKGLTGADFAVTEADRVVSSSFETAPDPRQLVDPPLNVSGLANGTRTITIDQRVFMHSVLPVLGPGVNSATSQLHILFPQLNYQRQSWEAALPAMITGLVAFAMAGAFSLLIAHRVTTPLNRLRKQVDGIAEGRFDELPEVLRDDEVADLSRAVNRMSWMLRSYEEKIRLSEKLRTLGQIGAGLAHQLRNSATGCRMAIELHLQECDAGSELPLQVALKELGVMENTLRRFLAMGDEKQLARDFEKISLEQLAREIVALVSPTAAHLGVGLAIGTVENLPYVRGQRHELQQLLTNLVRNAIEAAARPMTTGETGIARVDVRLASDGEWVRLEVVDSGSGPPDTISRKLFQPFVTDKPEGIGLGLAVARSIAVEHDGMLDWERIGGKTVFTLQLPAVVAG